MKTTREWADHLPEPIRTQFLENCEKAIRLDFQPPEISMAIACGFNWDQTPQKHFYWKEIYNRALKGEFDKPLTEQHELN